MPRRGKLKINMVKGSEKAMEAFTAEVAEELGFGDKMKEHGYKGLTTFEAGTLGGTMTRKIQAMGEQMIMKRYEAGEQKLIPPELAPDPKLMRNMTNNGNSVIDGKIQDDSEVNLESEGNSQGGQNTTQYNSPNSGSSGNLTPNLKQVK